MNNESNNQTKEIAIESKDEREKDFLFFISFFSVLFALQYIL